MGRVFQEGPYVFRVNANDWIPHAHVEFGGDRSYRINLRTGRFMDGVPPAEGAVILQIFRKHVEELWAEWNRLPHAARKGDADEEK